MSVQIQLCEKDNALWDDYVTQDTRSHFFHQWAYHQVVTRTFGHRPYYLAAFHQQEMVGILPLFAINSRIFGNFLVSLPFVDYGGVCARDEVTAQALLQESIQIAKRERIQVVELRHQYPNTWDLPTQLNKVNLILPLDSPPEKVWKRLEGETRNQVRKALKFGLQFETGGLEKLPCFYRVWSHNMRDLGTPAYPLAFFQHLLEAFAENSEVLLVTYRGQPVGGGIAIYFRSIMEVPWASSLRKYFSYCPNNLLYWGAINRGCERGCKEFHFGRSTKGSGNYRFKKQWGAKDQQLYYQYYMVQAGNLPNLDPHSQKYKMGVVLWKKLPVCVANFLSRYIIRSIP